MLPPAPRARFPNAILAPLHLALVPPAPGSYTISGLDQTRPGETGLEYMSTIRGYCTFPANNLTLPGNSTTVELYF